MKVVLEPNEELLVDFRDNDGTQFVITYNKRGVMVYVGQDEGESGVIFENPKLVSDTLIDSDLLLTEAEELLLRNKTSVPEDTRCLSCGGAGFHMDWCKA